MTSRHPIRRVKVHRAKIVTVDWARTRVLVIEKDDEKIEIHLDGRRREEWDMKIDKLMAEEAVVYVEYLPQLWEIGGKWGVVNYLLWVEREQS